MKNPKATWDSMSKAERKQLMRDVEFYPALLLHMDSTDLQRVENQCFDFPTEEEGTWWGQVLAAFARKEVKHDVARRRLSVVQT